MNFKTVQEAFNYWNGKTVKEIEQRATEIKNQIETDPNVDVRALNIELTGLNEAKENHQAKEGHEARGFNPITGANFGAGSYEATQGDVYASKEYRSAFYKSLMGKELNAVEKQTLNRAIEMEKRGADAYTASGNTPVVIPTTTLNEIISKARAEGGVIGIARAFNMPTKIAIPVATPSSKASWNTEGQAVESGKPTIAQVTFDAYEIIKVFSISAKVRTMSIDAFEAYLVDELQRCVFETIADSLINGTGTNQGTGLEHGVTWDTTNSVTATKAKGITYKDVVATVAKLKRGYGRGAKWVLNNATLYNAFYGMTDDNGKPIFIADPKDDTVGRILGFDVVVDDYVADNVCYFGNFSYLGYNLANGIAVESSTQSSFKSGRVDYRGMAIADTQVIVPEAFIKLSVATA